MSTRYLYVWVEGEDDTRFVERVIVPRIQKRYDWVGIVEYATKTPEWRSRFINSIKRSGADYMYLADFDLAKCITKKKALIQQTVKSASPDRILVAINLIEAWYLAGLSGVEVSNLKLNQLPQLETLTKQQFLALIPRKYQGTRREFMIEVLDHFSLRAARGKSPSFSYCAARLGL